ncbi:3-methyladenine DNA glycosylase [Vallicoccus soli]|uniref:3-methyladenine DNA glycosylase n=1 Tax=Vallicoccus soli TaxID=2339232 RepID=A0A3A3ZAV9_9ACTN|nr:3-methyladenine DNA glycosylase [Vallicoccus soli]RJK98226.1 3-methyladenine DNA glycosylase [Vallicoccus soli]
MEVLAEPVWRARRAAHEARVDAWTAGHRERARTGRAHPVEDFLFTYYSQRPARLRRWSPGAGVVCAGGDELLGTPGFVAVDGGAAVEPLPAARRAAAASVRTLLARTAGRAPSYGCFGLHEWAMVHRQEQAEVRHAAWPLRLGPKGTTAVVERSRVRCSHVDAFRFFTPTARPLNELQPTRATQADLEQPGCLHATMDLYKWAYKHSPQVPSELVGDCFALAREVRELDMRASPYDLSALGYAPVAVEEPAGRAEYAAAQRAFAERAAPLRARLVAALDALLA